MSLQLKRYQVDAFAESIFKGNPAVVCPLDTWLPDSVMQNIAMENNLSETAFYVKEGEGFRIRWFTPTIEVNLCGHATLATAHVLFNHENFSGKVILFQSKSGLLEVSRDGETITLDFPADLVTEIPITNDLIEGLHAKPIKLYKGRTDYMVVLENEEQVRNCNPDFTLLGKLPARGIIITARGKEADFVSRFFAPKSGINEDPVTGSAHTTLIPYWAKVLNKTRLSAYQLSARGGKLQCELKGDRVSMGGIGKLFSTGIIYLE